MAIKIDTASAKIDIVAGQAAPTASVNQGPGNITVANLTRNFNSDPTQVGFAFEFFGRVKVTGAAGNKVTGFQFGFVQFIRHTFMGLFYAGRKAHEGGISILLHPAITTAFLVDAFSASTLPFMLPATNDLAQGEVFTQMGDHPVFAIDQRQHNFTTGVDNFLFHMVDDRDAWSIFLMQDDAGKFVPLAHTHWELRYNLMFDWRNGTIQLGRNSSSFKVDPFAKGAPPDPAVQALLASLGPSMSPLANQKAKEALKTCVVHPNANRKDLDRRFANVPPTFFL